MIGTVNNKSNVMARESVGVLWINTEDLANTTKKKIINIGIPNEITCLLKSITLFMRCTLVYSNTYTLPAKYFGIS